MLENKPKQNSNSKRQMRKGGLFTNRNKRVKGGIGSFKALDIEELNFRTGEAIGFDGQFAVEDNPFGLTEPAPVGTSNKAVVFTDIGTNAILGMRSSIFPVTTNFYRSGASSFAWAAVYSYAFPAPSDKRLKDDIENLDYGLEHINKLNPVSFIYKSDLKRQVRLGLIAQEAKEVIPEIVSGGDKEMYTVSYDEIVPVLINAVKELSLEVKSLKEKML